MAISDYVPNFGEGNLSTYYRNVLGVPIRKRIVVAVIAVFGLFLIFVCGLLLSRSAHRLSSKQNSLWPIYVPLTQSMNVSVDPCSNFYEFTCGLWSKNEEVVINTRFQIKATSFELLQTYFDKKKQEIFENSLVSSDLPRVVNDAIKYFEACNSEKHDTQFELNYLKSYFQQIMGGWPALRPEEWDDSAFDWTQASALLLKTLGIGTVFDVYSMVDDYNASRKTLYMTPPVNKVYTHGVDSAPQMLYSVLRSLNERPIANVSDILDSILKSEEQWGQIFHEASAVNLTRTTFKELKEILPEFEWMFYFRTFMNDTLNKLGTDISEDDVIYINNFKAIEKAIAFFNGGLSKMESANLFGWLVAKKIWFLIPGVFEEYHAFFVYEPEELIETRKSVCFEYVFKLYESSVDYIFVKNSSLACLPDGKVLVNYLKNALRNRLLSSDWLDDSTKEFAILKLDYMKSIIGFQSYLSDKTEYDAIFDEYPPLKTSPLETYFDLNAYFMFCMVSTIKAAKTTTYLMPRSITHVSAYYDTQSNIFTLPLSVYNRPFYHSDGPWYLNFGAIGTVVGHEMMHGFDRVGCQRGETGSLKNWWSTNSSEMYEQRAECFTDQFSSYPNRHFKSNRSDNTLDEDIADTEGLRLAYLAYKQWTEDNGQEEMHSIFKHDYSAEQMFFMSYGSLWCSKIDPEYGTRMRDKHSLPEWRVNGAVSNSEYFSKAFHCPKGSPMNPDKKCAIW